MSEFKLEFVGKQVKDLYGTLIGKVMGMVTDIDDSMKNDVELVYVKYDKRLQDLEENANHLNKNLESRLKELEEESHSIKTILFDAKLQFRSNEMTEEIYQQINIYTNELLEHINLEKAEINNVRTKLSQQTLENNNVLTTTTPNTKLTEDQQVSANTAKPTQQHQDEESNIENVTVSQVMTTATANVDTSEIKEKNTSVIEGKTAEEKEGKNSDDEREENWLNQVIHNE